MFWSHGSAQLLQRGPSRFSGLLAALLLGAANPATAGNDEPIPFPDEQPSSPRKNLPEHSEPTHERPDEVQVEKQDREKSLAKLDDPNIGLAFEAILGVMLLDSSRGNLVEPSFDAGFRFTWEFGRELISNELIRESLWFDVAYMHASLHDGTSQVFEDSSYHYFSIAPAYEFFFGQGSPYGVFVQLGGGLAYEYTDLHSGTDEFPTGGVKPLIQYGVGLRGEPRPTPEFPFRISARIELTRFRRQYMDDTFLGGSLGISF